MGQPWRPGARPGLGLGAIGQNGGQQLGQIIGGGEHRRVGVGVLLQSSRRRTGGAAAASWSRPRARRRARSASSWAATIGCSSSVLASPMKKAPRVFPGPLVIVVLPASWHPNGGDNSEGKTPTKSSFAQKYSCYLGITRRCSLFSRCLLSRGAGSQGGKAQANQQGKAGGDDKS